MEFPNNGDSSDPELVISRPEMYKNGMESYRIVCFLQKKDSVKRKLGSFLLSVQNPPQKTAPSRTQEPSRASVRMLEKCLSTKIFNPGGFRRKTPAVIIGGRKTEKHSQNPEFDDFLLQQFPHCNTGSTGSEKRGNS